MDKKNFTEIINEQYVLRESIIEKSEENIDNMISFSRNLDKQIDEADRVLSITRNTDTIILDIEKQFVEQTDITNTKDMSFLFLATGLLCTKWIILKTLAPLEMDFSHKMKLSEDRLDSTELGGIDAKGKSIESYKDTLERVKANYNKIEEKLKECTTESERKVLLKKINNNKKRQKELEKIIHFFVENPELVRHIEEIQNQRDKLLDQDKDGVNTKYRTVTEILTRPVPYDAMNPVSDKVDIPVSLIGGNHHAYTLGHDPILGWVFGTMNILTRSITLNFPLWPTYWVMDSGNKIKCRTEMGVISTIISSMNSIEEDNKRLAAATLRQGLHLVTDKYCKTGLPINIPLMSADKAQELIEMGWNSEEAKSYLKKVKKIIAKDAAIVGIQFMLSYLINQIVKAIYLMLYDENVDGDLGLYEVRSRKILMTANTISTTSNFAYVAITKQLSALDIGGAIETIHRLVYDSKYIRKVKEEYIENSFRNLVMVDEDELYSIYEEDNLLL